MNKPNLEALDTAFLQLSLAFKLWHFIFGKIERGCFDKESFDSNLTVPNDDDTDRVSLPPNEFNTNSDVILGLQNNIVICFGIAVITLWEAINEHCRYSDKNHNPLKTREDKLAGLCYMIRCCFAHSPAMPQWKINKKYRLKYTLGNKTIDLTSLDGELFHQSHIGGYEALWHLKAEASECGLLKK